MAGEEEVGARDHFFGNLQRQEELIKRDGHQSVSGQHWIFASPLVGFRGSLSLHDDGWHLQLMLPHSLCSCLMQGSETLPPWLSQVFNWLLGFL